MSRLKVYTSHDGTYRRVVAAANQAAAKIHLNTSYRDLRDQGTIGPDDKTGAYKAAMSKPGSVFRTRMRWGLPGPEREWEEEPGSRVKPAEAAEGGDS